MKKRGTLLLVFATLVICLFTVEIEAKDVAIVAMYGSAEVDFINLNTKKVLKRLRLAKSASLPIEIAKTPDNSTAIVTCENGYICFIDIINMNVLKTLKLLRGPETIGSTLVPNEFYGVGVTPDGTTAIVTEVNEFGYLYFLDTANKILSSPNPIISVGDEPGRLAITSDGNYAYVVDSELSRVFVVDIPNRLVDRVELVGAIGDSSDIVLTSDETRVLITDSNDGWIYLVDVSNTPWTILDTIQEVGLFTEPASIALSPIDTLAIVANQSDESVSIVNYAGDVLVIEDTINVNGTPQGVALTADGMKAVVTLFNTSLVAIIDVNTRSIATIRLRGRAPAGVVIANLP